MTSLRARLLTVVLVAAGVSVLALVGLVLSRGASGLAPLWLADAAVVALLIRFPALGRINAMIGTAAALVAMPLLIGRPLDVSLLLATANSLEITAALWLFARFRDAALSPLSPRNLAVFLICAGVVGPLVSALLGATAVAWTGNGVFGTVVLTWFASHLLGQIMLGPLLLAAGSVRRINLPHSGKIGEIAGIWALAAIVAGVVFVQSRYPALFFVFPVLTLAAFRLRFVGAATTILVIAIVSTVATMSGHGPIAGRLPGEAERILFLQAFLAVAVVATLPLASILVERAGIARRLVEGEQRFRRLAQAAPVAMFRTDGAGVLLYGNARWVALTGCEPDGRTAWLDLLPPASRADGDRLWQEGRRSGEGFSAELVVRRADGDAGWVSLTLEAEHDDDGASIGWVGVAIDIEERRRADARLAASELQYRLLADHSNDLIVRVGMDGIRRYVSPASLTILGYTPEEMLGATPIAVIHPEDRARVERVCRSMLEGAPDPVCSYRQRRRDGSYVWLEANYRLVRDESGRPVEFVASVRDIGKRRSAEMETAAANARLEESHRLLQMAERLAGIGHWRLDAGAGADLFWSDEVYRIHGRTVGDRPALADAITVYHPDDREKVSRAVAQALTDGTPFGMLARIIRPDGAIRHVESSARAEYAPDGSVVGLVGVFRDVTVTVETEAALIAARDEARALAETKSAFLATMSHEIRTPMTGVLGMIELLRTDLSPADRTRFFNNLEQSASLLMTVLDDVLDFSKIESRNLVLEDVDFDLAELAINTLDLFHHAASKKGLLLSLACPIGRALLVRGDPVRIQQVLSNLISNAVKFTTTGRIELRIDVDGDARKRFVRCAVSDTGVGIAADVIDKLFEPFVQADASTTRRFGGTGLGLAISRRLVEAMNGTIEVDSTPGVGSTFRFEVTLGAGSAAKAITHRPRAAPKRALSVLLAEDNQINQALVAALVRAAGHSITCVENGRLAVEAAEAQVFDIILMDMQMPEMDGLAATRAIRGGSGPCANAPIVALTADASAERRRFYDNAGLTEFLTKPIDTRLLTEKLEMIAGAAVADGPAPPAPVIAGDMLDEAKLVDLEAAIGPVQVHRLLGMLTDELRTRPGAIVRLIEAGNHGAVNAEAHALKGLTLNIGAARIGEIARAIEEGSEDGNDLASLCRDLMDAARATLVAIDDRAKRSKSA